jgi:hypothetical protein
MRRPATRTLLVAVIGVSAVLMLLGYLGKQRCAGPPFNQFGQSARLGEVKYTHYCYSDIQQLYPFRGIRQHTFPYLHGRLDGDQPVGGALEYPVLTGLFIWATGLFAHNDAQFLAASALFLVPFGLLTGWLLALLTGRRAFVWAAAPALVTYSFLNWDLLVTAAFAAAVYAWWRGRPALAAGLLGVGAALKLYPGFFLVPLVAERLAARDRRGAVRVGLAGVGAFLAVNAPFMLTGPEGWWATYAFQQARPADLTTNSIWYWGFPRLTTAQLNTIIPPLVAGAWLVALAVGWWRARRTGSYPWLQVCGAMLCAFLLLNKVHSPQYTLWLLPFLVLLAVRWGWWVTLWATDLVLFLGLFGWYQTIVDGGDFGPAKQAVIVGVWVQAALLGLLYVVFLSASLAILPSPGPPGRSRGFSGRSRFPARSGFSGRSRGRQSSTSPAVSGPPTGGPATGGSSDPPGSGQSDDPSGQPSAVRSGGGAPSSTPPAGSSTPAERTTSYSGRRMSRTTSATTPSTARSRATRARRNQFSSSPLLPTPRYQ